MKAVLAGAASLRERIAGGPTAVSVRTLPLTTLLYPTRYAFGGAALSPAPFVTLTHRCLLVQFRQGAALKTLLFNPTDIDRARRAPYFARVIERFGETMSSMMVTRFEALEAQLARLGLSPGDIDYVAFDHFHTQDLRGLLGTEDGRTTARFPNATLLASRREWDDWADLHPMQRAWYVADGREGVSTERVHFVERDLELGDGVMLLRTPGHTSGNQTLFVKTDRGVWGVSENGTCADAWSPSSSRVAGVARAASDAGLDVILNANTVEYGADQYTSMLLERAMVDRVPSAPEWVQMFPSSEATPAVTAPGLSPTYLHHRVEHGVVESRGAREGVPAGFGAA
ncbi:MAG: hypothetical protein R3A52_22570 [Polyangiales bacterium]